MHLAEPDHGGAPHDWLLPGGLGKDLEQLKAICPADRPFHGLAEGPGVDGGGLGFDVGGHLPGVPGGDGHGGGLGLDFFGGWGLKHVPACCS